LEASQQFPFYRVGLLAPCPTSIPEDQASVFISPRGRVATHFSRFLRHAWVMVGLFLFLGHHMEIMFFIHFLISQNCVIFQVLDHNSEHKYHKVFVSY
jgi:hypothetical protein